MKSKFGRIKLSEIDATDLSFLITAREDIDDLAASINRVGLINPPLLLAGDQGRYVIVYGRRRIAACLKAGLTDIEARIAEKNTNRLECIKVAISDNVFQRPLNWVEISRALNLLMEEITDQNELMQVLPDLGLPQGRDIIEKAVRMIHFAKPIQAGLVAGQIPFAMALELGGLEPEAGSLLANLFQQLPLSLNKQREILEWAMETAKLESRPLIEMIREEEIQAILQNPDLDKNQKSHAIRKFLRTRRYPSILKSETLFQEKQKSLKIPAGIRLLAPKDFESDRYAFHIEFKNQEQLAERLKRLERLSEARDLKDLLTGITFDNDTTDHSSTHASPIKK